jgi:ubiquinone/menaquinone biosynthesis C-methylase UbiE
MSHDKVFDPAQWKKLESDERRERMSPATLAVALGLTGDETVLDVGCGTGFFAEAIIPACGAYVGVDLSSDMLAVFRGKPAAAAPNVTLRVGSADALPVADGSVDVALHVNLLHEVADPARFGAELYRVVKPGGRLVAVDWEARETHGGPPVGHRVSCERALGMMEEAGFVEAVPLPVWDDWYVVAARKPPG